MPLMPAKTPSIFEVASCSITLAEAFGQLYDTLMFNDLSVGVNCTLNKGIIPAPIVINTNITKTVEKADMRIRGFCTNEK